MKEFIVLNAIICAFIALFITSVTGWWFNVLWLFQYTGEITGEFVLSTAGLLIFPIGVLHGWYTVF